MLRAARAGSGVWPATGSRPSKAKRNAKRMSLLRRRRTGPPTLFRFYDPGHHFRHGEPQIPGFTYSVLVTLQEFDGFADRVVPRDCLRIQIVVHVEDRIVEFSDLRQDSCGTFSSSKALGPANTTASGCVRWTPTSSWISLRQKLGVAVLLTEPLEVDCARGSSNRALRRGRGSRSFPHCPAGKRPAAPGD